MDNKIDVIFPWEGPLDRGDKERIKWSVGHSRYEISVPILQTYENSMIVEHCVEVMDKVRRNVSTNNHRVPSLYEVFPRTLSVSFETTWNLLVDAPGYVRNLANFQTSVRDFIALAVDDQARKDTVKQLLNPKKPIAVSVQDMWTRYQRIVTFVEWMPRRSPSSSRSSPR